jgi:hypothetical protein
MWRIGGVILILGVVGYGSSWLIIEDSRVSGFLNFDVVANLDNFLEYDSDPGSLRVLGYGILFENVLTNNMRILFGVGSSVVARSSAYDLGWMDGIELYFPKGFSDGILFCASVGIIGLVVVLFMFGYGIFWIKEYLQIERSSFMRMNGYAFGGMSIVCIASLGYTRVWSSQIALVYWVVAGVIMRRYCVLSEGEGSKGDVFLRSSMDSKRRIELGFW